MVMTNPNVIVWYKLEFSTAPSLDVEHKNTITSSNFRFFVSSSLIYWMLNVSVSIYIETIANHQTKYESSSPFWFVWHGNIVLTNSIKTRILTQTHIAHIVYIDRYMIMIRVACRCIEFKKKLVEKWWLLKRNAAATNRAWNVMKVIYWMDEVDPLESDELLGR